MKQTVLVAIFAVVIVALLGSAGVMTVYYFLNRPPTPTPFTYEEMQELQEKEKIGDDEIPRLLACFHRNDEDLRLQATLTLKKMGAPAVDPVREKLKDRNAKVRFCAAQTLGYIGPPAAPAADDLVARLQDDNADVRYKSIYALGQIGVKSDAVLIGVLKAVDDPDEGVRATAQETLGKIGPPPKESLETLTKLASDSSPGVRTHTIKLLGQLGEPAVPTLLAMLKSADVTQRIAILEAAAPLGSAAKPLLPELEKMMIENPHWDGEEALFNLYKKCGSEGAASLERVLKSLYDKKSPHFALADTRAATLIRVIGEIGPDAKVAVPTLVAFLSEHQNVRLETLQALGDIGPAAAKEARPAVEALLTQPALREAAQTALNRMGVRMEK